MIKLLILLYGNNINYGDKIMEYVIPPRAGLLAMLHSDSLILISYRRNCKLDIIIIVITQYTLILLTEK